MTGLTAEELEEKKVNAIIIFGTIVADHIIPIVLEHKNDSEKLWLVLKNTYESGALEQKLVFEHQLHDLKMFEDQSVEDYLPCVADL
ncbi:unnamed protein product [Calypogeia fissa]